MKFGLFFGAGAEVGYGLPLGGKFAIDLFRQDNTKEKSALREVLNGLNNLTMYATKWLPDNYKGKRIHAFGKTEFRSLIESSIEYRKATIVERLNAFDQLAANALDSCDIKQEILEQKFKEFTGKDYGSEIYSQEIKVNPTLTGNVLLFESEFYSAVLDVIRKEGDTADIEKYATSILQLLIGAYGQELVQKVNQEIFTKAPDDLTILDDISGMFRLEFDKIGNTALGLLLASGARCEVNDTSGIQDILLAVLQEALELLFTEVLDYQSLIDSHWRYLYSPREDWAKFTKMVIFLHTTRSYMLQQLEANIDADAEGYYHDMLKLLDSSDTIEAIGTANYNNLIERVCGKIIEKTSIYHLNGSVNDFYNPYKNTVIHDDDGKIPTDQIHVPFMLTQSGVKPLTSISMSRRYVELFDKFKETDAIIAIGYNFNIDDNHINGLFRQLIEDEGKTLFWVTPIDEKSDGHLTKTLEEKMRLPTSVRDQVHIVRVNRESRQTDDGLLWVDQIRATLAESSVESSEAK
ncbi:MAG: hypothetical protein CBB62_11065 [Micavibrio sp. TMED2]|nr:hypothetical protein [Alphaproteobacteria bacterium]MAS48393.1 hypothetical protein [Alphaproteobacteria bacterium]MAX97063.1 hypothetical protein [Alphaproteobacteria bacterium]OUT40014.1 MAG: hypothetical protein CBB62_11065 [Micavibrio sp. TMED2]HCH37863.1 hypothetical protein [Acidobacteriota bacterium]|tara:strand:+ start:4758 stop:6320 length:1563 start_codon:yes stop_codon:yes gene_type:complete